jgi:hypothetical protein
METEKIIAAANVHTYPCQQPGLLWLMQNPQYARKSTKTGKEHTSSEWLIFAAAPRVGIRKKGYSLETSNGKCEKSSLKRPSVCAR